MALGQDSRLTNDSLTDAGLPYSRTGLVKRVRPQNGWDDHRGASVTTMISDSRNTVNPLAVSAQPPYRDSNRVCCFLNADKKASVVPRGNPLTRFLIKKTWPEQKQQNVPVWAIAAQYASDVPVPCFKSVKGRQYRAVTTDAPATGVALAGVCSSAILLVMATSNTR